MKKGKGQNYLNLERIGFTLLIRNGISNVN